MKSVGQQLQEARLAKNWTPELAARETKIKADRVRDLEADDYTNFSSPTYARGFVRTYARALGLDEYRILRQLDNKLPEDDNASFVQDNGSLPYVPEPSTQAMHVSSAPRTGLYVVFGLGVAVTAVIAFVLLQAYRAGELQRYFAPSGNDNMIASAVAPVPDETPPHAVAVDPNDTTHSARALPVDLNALGTPPSSTNSVAAVAPTVTPVPNTRRALPVDLTQLAAGDSAPATPPPTGATTPAPSPSPAAGGAGEITPSPDSAPAPSAAAQTESVTPSESTKVHSASNATEVHVVHQPPRALPVDPSDLVAENQAPTDGPINPANPPPTTDSAPSPNPTTQVDLGPSANPPSTTPVDARAPKRLVLTASRDSFIRVTSLDQPSSNEVLYASVLRGGQSLEFDGRKFSVNVGVPSAVDIMLDGVNYGPHSDGNSPETFTIQSHQP